MRKLSSTEEKRLAVLTSKSVETCLIEPTGNALKKSIMDATVPVKNYLREQSIHDYATQGRGAKEHGINIKSLLVSNNIVSSTASLYLPKTKEKGDPRIWFTNLREFARPNDILALIAHQNEIHVINLTQTNLVDIIEEKKAGPVFELLNEISRDTNAISEELLRKLQNIKQTGPHKSVMDKPADTAIGRTLESLLDIEMNSSQSPDYKGIELKSFRSRRNNRKNLFAKTPNWELSKLKSAAEILENFGYHNEDNRFQLYCTVSAKKANPNGLQLKVDLDEDVLMETSSKEGFNDYLTWLMEDLRKALLKKHNETFWIEADSEINNSRETFDFTKVLHTRKPIISQFDLLLEQGSITMDHTHKRLPSGREDNRGFLFKISPTAFNMLFPPSEIYHLQ